MQQSTYCVLSAFTFLSGFLAFREFKGAKDVLKYYLKRLIRLWPLFALAEIAMVLLGINEGKMLPWVLTGLGWAKEPFPLTLWFVGMIFLFYLLNPVLSSKKWYIGLICAVCAEALFVVLNLTLATDDAALKRIGENALEMGLPNSAQVIAEEVLKLIEK